MNLQSYTKQLFCVWVIVTFTALCKMHSQVNVCNNFDVKIVDLIEHT